MIGQLELQIKLKINDVFSDGLLYEKPNSLLYSSGARKLRNSTELHWMAVECIKDLLELRELKNWLNNL
ncbi:hypothetical protein RhiirA5_407958 [Rhizophagus irregularis]|uniref:Uncharacterized protein n=1 Tax=Rhizophagus irregularis TaxID=588596 RepID=A0A2N0Q9B3_9GLOM|nr:hypothetical protein RhiirA5_407958 [Rhizophagus irregularis]